jgi:nucleoside-diphosphate-sugar epimerase
MGRRTRVTRPTLLFGANGNLGTALRQATKDRPLVAMPWQETISWLQTDGAARWRDSILDTFREKNLQDADIVFAGGLTDPNSPPQALEEANALLPQRVILATRDMPGLRYLTFGTAMERFAGAAAANPYVASKARLAAWLKDQACAPDLRGRVMHLQIHTLYGGSHALPHMFLGQMISALKAGRPFAMSAGTQLREYHHVADVAQAALRLLSRAQWPEEPILALSTGQPVRLADLATAVFTMMQRQTDLQIGALSSPPAENFELVFEPAPDWLLGTPREPVTGVAEWVRDMVARQNV